MKSFFTGLAYGSLAELIPPVMNKNISSHYKKGFASLITSIATGLLVLTAVATGAPTKAEAPVEELAYIELAQHFGLTVREGEVLDEQTKQVLVKAKQVEQYYLNQKTEMPMAQYAYEMVMASERYGLDYALMPAIARFETSGGRNLCKSESGAYNPFGFGSCKMAFDSFEHAFDHVAYSLSGKNPNTTIYANKTIEEKLLIYNPPSVVGILPGYHKHILNAVKEIKSEVVKVNGYRLN